MAIYECVYIARQELTAAQAEQRASATECSSTESSSWCYSDATFGESDEMFSLSESFVLSTPHASAPKPRPLPHHREKHGKKRSIPCCKIRCRVSG